MRIRQQGANIMASRGTAMAGLTACIFVDSVLLASPLGQAGADLSDIIEPDRLCTLGPSFRMKPLSVAA